MSQINNVPEKNKAVQEADRKRGRKVSKSSENLKTYKMKSCISCLKHHVKIGLGWGSLKIRMRSMPEFSSEQLCCCHRPQCHTPQQPHSCRCLRVPWAKHHIRCLCISPHCSHKNNPKIVLTRLSFSPPHEFTPSPNSVTLSSNYIPKLSTPLHFSVHCYILFPITCVQVWIPLHWMPLFYILHTPYFTFQKFMV